VRAIYVTRWLSRPPHKRYTDTVKQIAEGKWNHPEYQIFLGVHGKASLGEEEIFMSEKVLDFREDTDGTGGGQLFKQCFNHALNNGFEVCGLMDDDARFDDPHLFMEFADLAEREFKPGCHGPFGHYRYMAMYKCELEEPFLEMTRDYNLATYGMQFYGGEILKKTWPVIKDVLPKVWMTDEPMFRLAKAYGMPLYEYYVPGYQHVASFGVARSYGEEWFKKKLKSNIEDVDHWMKATADLGLPPEAMSLFQRNILNCLRGDVNKALKKNTEEELQTWEIHPGILNTWEALEAAYTVLFGVER
jgi:hypothetical protein